MTTLDSFTWGSSPAIPVSFSYEYRRSGGDMQYRIRIVIGTVSGGSYFGYAIGVSLNCGGVKVSKALKKAEVSTWTDSISYTTDWLTVAQKLSGTTALSVILTTDAPRGNSSHSYSLAVSPAASSITVPNLTMGTAGVIRVSKADAAYTHTIVCRFGGTDYTICTKSSASSISWTPALSMAQKIPNATSGTATFTATTYSGTTSLGSKSVTARLYVPISVKPTAEICVEMLNSNPVVSSWGVAVKGYTRLRYTVTASGVQGASITGYAVTIDGKRYTTATGTTEVLESCGNIAAAVAVTDSRGRTASANSSAVQVYDCAVPAISAAEVCRCLADGTPGDNGTYLKCRCTATGSSVGGHNTLTCRVRYRQQDGVWSNYITLQNGTAEVIDGALSVRLSYEAELSAVDALGNERTVKSIIPTAAVAMHLRQGGKGAAFGKYSEEADTLECAWDAQFQGDMTVNGTLCLGGHSGAVGEVLTAGGDTVGVANNTGTALAGLTLEAGTWLIAASVNFAANAAGVRYCGISETSGDVGGTCQRLSAVSGEATVLQAIRILSADDTVVYCNVCQSSGGVLNCSGQICAVRIA